MVFRFALPTAALLLAAVTTSNAAIAAPSGHYIPTRVVPGDVLLELSGIDHATFHNADFGDQKARAAIDARVKVLRAIEPTLVYQRRLPSGWGLFHVDAQKTLAGEARTEQAVKNLSHGKGVTGFAVNAWKTIQRTPNDEFFSLMWHLQAIGAPAAWDVTTGVAGQTVGVVDTGTVLEHEDLVGKDAGGFDFVSDPASGNDGDGRDANYEDPGDGCGSQEGNSFHGTHVAGTILADADNGIGITGINWEAKLITIRVLGCGGGATTDIMEGLVWAAGATDVPLDPNNPNGATVPDIAPALIPHVFNLSLGGQGDCDQFSQQITDEVTQAGLIVVVAAGNDPGPVESPGNCPSVVAVAAYGAEADHPLTSYSSFGNEIAIVAPGGDAQDTGQQGDDVLSCASPSITGPNNAPYIFEEGTSMATPHVTGTISLMLSINPSLDRDQAVQILQSTGDTTCRNCQNKLALRADRAVAAVTQVTTNPGDACVNNFCSPGQACANNVCATACSTDGDCAGSDVCGSVAGLRVCVAGGTGEGEGEGSTQVGEGEGGTPEDCNVERGNMDCPVGQGCTVDGSGASVCVNGLDTGGEIGALCSKDSQCSTGLCERGVCTVTCDFDQGACRSGYSCDQNAVPGGLCEPDSCRDEGTQFCGDFSCSYSPEQHYVCASGPSNYSCSDVGRAPSSSTGAFLGVGALALAGAVVSRRRRTTAASCPTDRRCS